MTGLFQTGNPDILIHIRPYWLKYLEKINERFYETELNKLISCFKSTERRLYILFKDGKIKGFCTLDIDSDTNSLFVCQVSTDDVRLLKEKIEEIADKIGAINIVYYTERNPKAWERLIKGKTIGYLMEV